MNKTKKAVVIHTSPVSLDNIKESFNRQMPHVELVNIIDDSLLAEVMQNGQVTPSIIRRICTYALEAQAMGADILLNQCSSVSEAVDVARRMLQIPYLKIDEPMAEQAVLTGSRIAVVATVASTVGPSTRLVECVARRLDKTIQLQSHLVDGALDILMKDRDRERHNTLVLNALDSLQNQVDVIILAQGSMHVLRPMLDRFHVPVLTSIDSGISRVREMLDPA
jgi:Asp/Glu/hydantoin racemase